MVVIVVMGFTLLSVIGVHINAQITYKYTTFPAIIQPKAEKFNLMIKYEEKL